MNDNDIYVIDTDKPYLGGNLHTIDTCGYSESVWKYIIEKYNIKSCLDVGSGKSYAGKYISSLVVEVTNIEGLEVNIQNAVMPTEQHDLTEGPYIKPVDLVNCIEVVEHIEEKFIHNLMSTLCNGKYVLITHALPGQEGWHHVNCQHREYWIEKFITCGYTLLEDEVSIIKNLAEKEQAYHINRSALFFKKL